MVCIITGASSGVGKACAEYFSKQGYKVYGFSRTKVENASFESLSVDVTNLEVVKAAVEQILSKESQIDFVLNNAGKGMLGSFEDATKQEIFDLFNLNLIGCLNLVKAVMPQMRKQNSGIFFNVSSVGSSMGLPFRGYYSASKAALDKCTEAFRFEIKNTGIQALTLNLGDVDTNIASGRILSEVSTHYKDVYKRVTDKIGEHVSAGFDPIEVAYFVEKCLKSKKRLKSSYTLAPFSQKRGVILKKFLPKNLYEKLLANYSGV
ncbi:MAG: short-chain dehydrogenase/reductase [Flavobacteriaceae bacterium]|nr:MAG: short-chain dehydrogenase/reductase [Flavobacteriaceae bacterium]